MLKINTSQDDKWGHWDKPSKEGLAPEDFETLSYQKDIIATASRLRRN